MKAQCIEPGQMHAQHPGMCRQVTENAPSLGPKWRYKTAANFFAVQTQIWLLSFLLILKKWLRVYLHVRLFGTAQMTGIFLYLSPPHYRGENDWKTAQIKMALLFLAQDGVSRIHKNGQIKRWRFKVKQTAVNFFAVCVQIKTLSLNFPL